MHRMLPDVSAQITRCRVTRRRQRSPFGSIGVKAEAEEQVNGYGLIPVDDSQSVM